MLSFTVRFAGFTITTGASKIKAIILVTILYRTFDLNNDITQTPVSLELGVINDAFTVEEVKLVINTLKNKKSPGVDNVPAEFIKHSSETLFEMLTLILNYIAQRAVKKFREKYD